MLKNYASGNFFSINTVTQLRTIIKALNLGILHYSHSNTEASVLQYPLCSMLIAKCGL